MVLDRTFLITTALGPQETLSAIQPLLIRPDTAAERASALAEAASDDSGLSDRYLGVVETGGFRIVRPTLAASVRSGARSGIFRSIHARPRSAHAPGRSGSVILSVLVDPSAIVPSMNAPTTARVAAGDSPVGPTHAPRRPLTCHPARFTTVARAHNPACSGLRVAARRSPLTHVG